MAWHIKWAADVLTMDGDVEQGDLAPEGCGQPLWPQMNPQPAEELIGTEQCELVNAHLIDAYELGADGTCQPC